MREPTTNDDVAATDERQSRQFERALYPIIEARRLLGGVSNTSFYAAVKRGEIRLTKLGRRTFVAAAEIQRIASGEAA